MAGVKSTAILFIISIGIALIGLGGLFGTIFLVMISYILFLTIFKMESHSANTAAAGLFVFMFGLTLIGL
ncbi:MAG: hypothetical protein Q9M97_00790 [Candidatus Gracilibacteria bacterium]|nr:hypothetical protein [Candidatus Gracilibacteria bacterium]